MKPSVVEFPIEGMTCSACAARIEKVLNRQDGVSATVNFANESARIEYDAEKSGPAQLVALIHKATSSPWRGASLPLKA
ncbi:cation transporter [Paludibacterium denitrificans]|uniref:cation transporter n=1 Tax=Paludibacterium denitrificans TaxID=2675226 RepID=UPI001E2E4B07|nr:heavy metal-associated domain-containing protein [Paludibacterium denitrificans]